MFQLEMLNRFILNASVLIYTTLFILSLPAIFLWSRLGAFNKRNNTVKWIIYLIQSACLYTCFIYIPLRATNWRINSSSLTTLECNAANIVILLLRFYCFVILLLCVGNCEANKLIFNAEKTEFMLLVSNRKQTYKCEVRTHWIRLSTQHIQRKLDRLVYKTCCDLVHFNHPRVTSFLWNNINNLFFLVSMQK